MFSSTQTLHTSNYSASSRSLKAWIQSHVSGLNLATLLLLVALCFGYIVQVNHSVSKGYQIREFESQIHTLTLVNQKLEVQTQQAQALTNVAYATKMLGLVQAGQPEYMQSNGPSYALAQ